MVVGDEVRASVQVILERLFDVEKIHAGNVGELHFSGPLDKGKNGVLFALTGIAALRESGLRPM